MCFHFVHFAQMICLHRNCHADLICHSELEIVLKSMEYQKLFLSEECKIYREILSKATHFVA